MATIHTRSPVIIHPKDFELWLDCSDEKAEKIVPLMHPAADDYFVMEPTIIARNAPPPRPKAPPKPPSNGGQMDLL